MPYVKRDVMSPFAMPTRQTLGLNMASEFWEVWMDFSVVLCYKRVHVKFPFCMFKYLAHAIMQQVMKENGILHSLRGTVCTKVFDTQQQSAIGDTAVESFKIIWSSLN